MYLLLFLPLLHFPPFSGICCYLLVLSLSHFLCLSVPLSLSVSLSPVSLFSPPSLSISTLYLSSSSPSTFLILISIVLLLLLPLLSPPPSLYPAMPPPFPTAVLFRQYLMYICTHTHTHLVCNCLLLSSQISLISALSITSNYVFVCYLHMSLLYVCHVCVCVCCVLYSIMCAQCLLTHFTCTNHVCACVEVIFSTKQVYMYVYV